MFHPFRFNKIGKVAIYGKTVYFRKSPNVQWEIENYGESNEKYFIKVYDNYNLRSYKLEDSEIKKLKLAIKEQIESNKLSEKKLVEIQAPLKNAKYANFSKNLAEGVLQREYAITTANSKKPILGTYGAGPCLIVAIYDSKSKTAFLAHIDSATNLKSLTQILKIFNPKTSVVHLFGGDNSSKNMCMDVVEIFESNHFKLHNTDIVRSDWRNAASLAIDARNGQIYTPVEHYHLSTKNENQRLQLASFVFGKQNLRKIYDGRTDLIPKQRKATVKSPKQNLTKLPPIAIRTLFYSSHMTKLVNKLHKEQLINNRHDSAKAQRAYDKHFALILKK
ncbi:MAG: hypothetical protein PVG30_08890 [Gammaproteobacteria bacterium]|jgi:hypothetical protein